MTISSPPRIPLPFDAGATLPIVERYTDQRFRAVSRGRIHHARDEHLVQVVALSRLLDWRYLRYIFHWSKQGLDKARGYAENWPETVARYHDANLRVLDPWHAVGLVHAMQDGGWVKGRAEPLPDIVKLGMRGLREQGHTNADIARIMRLGFHTVVYGFRVPHHIRLAKRRVGLVL